MASEWDLQNPDEMILGLADMVGDGLMISRKCVMDIELAKEMLKKEDFSRFTIKRRCVWQTHDLKRRSRRK